jgi:hypothetical protein
MENGKDTNFGQNHYIAVMAPKLRVESSELQTSLGLFAKKVD